MDTAQPLISVIVPVYNTAPFLRKCLDSICNQTYRNLEIICINDGSTDSSAEILAEYATKDSRFIIIDQENAGQAAARNKGLQLARGEWITGVDSDDFIEPDTYEYCIKNLSHKADTKLIIFSFDSIDGDSGRILHRNQQPATGIITPSPYHLLRTDCYFWNKLWHRDLFTQSGIRFTEGMWFEDVALFYCIAPYLGQILYLPDVKAHYMRYGQFTSSMDQARALPHKNMERLRAVEIAFKHYARHELPSNMQNLKAGVLQLFYSQLLVFLTPETEQPAWSLLRSHIEQYQLLPKLSDTPQLALCYYMPPCALVAYNRQFAPMAEFELLLISGRLRKQYTRLLLLSLFIYGKKRTHIKNQLILIKQQLRRLRFLKKQIWKKNMVENQSLCLM